MTINAQKLNAWMDLRGVGKNSLAMRAGLSGDAFYRILKSGTATKNHVTKLASAMGMSLKRFKEEMM